MFEYPTVSILTLNIEDSLSDSNTVVSSFNIQSSQEKIHSEEFAHKWVSRIAHELCHFQKVLKQSFKCTLLKTADLFYTYSYISRTH